MSELIDNATSRKGILKKLILQLHQGENPETVRSQLFDLLGKVPYGDVVDVEQELIREGLPTAEVLKLCDIHTAAMQGVIDSSGARSVPAGHPVDTFTKENDALAGEISLTKQLLDRLVKMPGDADVAEDLGNLRQRLGFLSDVDKHYRRKENLLFPFLEAHGITGPPTVMWGKHDQARELLKNSLEAIETSLKTGSIVADEANALVKLLFEPATEALAEMIYKEKEILFPMCLDTLSESEWYKIYEQSDEIGYCLYDPKEVWTPTLFEIEEEEPKVQDRVQLPSGSLSPDELEAMLNTIPFDLTFVDKTDRVRYFTQGRERIFERNRSIIGRQVQLCHPPSSVHVVQKILDDFRAGRADSAPFWINLKGRFIHIEYFALRDKQGEYLGTLEVSQDLTAKRNLTGEQRLLSYEEK